MKNITNVLSDQFKEIQSELTTQFRSICDETNRNMFRVQFEVTRDINLMRSDFYQNISNMRNRMDEIQQMVEITKKSLSISPSTSFWCQRIKMRITKLRPRVPIHYYHLAPGVLTQNPKFKVITKPNPNVLKVLRT